MSEIYRVSNEDGSCSLCGNKTRDKGGYLECIKCGERQWQDDNVKKMKTKKEKILKLLEKYGIYHMTNICTGETIVDISPCALFEDDFDESLLLIIDKDGKISFQMGEL